MNIYQNTQDIYPAVSNKKKMVKTITKIFKITL